MNRIPATYHTDLAYAHSLKHRAEQYAKNVARRVRLGKPVHQPSAKPSVNQTRNLRRKDMTSDTADAESDSTHGVQHLRRLRRRAQALGIRGHTGGWIWINERACKADVRIEPRRVQGWGALQEWAEGRTRNLDWNLREILDGTRIGMPTLHAWEMRELAVALLAPLRCSVRINDTDSVVVE